MRCPDPRLALCALSLVVASLAHAQASRPFTVDDLVQLNRISEPALSPDGKTVAFTVRETDLAANRGRQDLWSLDIATKGAKPRRLTSHPENDNSPQWAGSGALYFLSSRGGSSQVWRLVPGAGEAEQVTKLPLDVGSFRIAPNGTRIVVSLEAFADCADLACTTERDKKQGDSKATGRTYDRIFIRHWDTWADGKVSQLYVLKLTDGIATGEPLALTRTLDADVPSKPFGDASEYAFSPDSTRLVFSARVKGKTEPQSTNFDLYQVPVDGGELTNLTADNPAWDTQPVFSPDGSMLAWRAMERPGFEADRFHLVVLDLKTGQRRALTQTWDRSVDSFAFATDGKTIYAATDHLGQHPLWAIDVKTGKPTALTGPGHVDDFTVGEKEIVFALSSLKSPSELYALTLKGGALRDLPRMNGAALGNLALGEPEQFTFAGANGETVYAYLIKPANFDPKLRYPIAFFVHGGPQSSYANAWSYRWNPQTYAGQGFAFIAIDFHGSPGYGQAFTDSISGDWGGKPLEDLKKGYAQALEKYPWLDANRACALGASYGGYMINWIAGNWSEPFKCLVNHDGIFDSRAMAYSTEELWFEEWEHGGAPFEHPENYEKWNPVNHVSKWVKPMLVIHGQLDYRVPDTQGISTFTALQRRGIASRLLYFPNENHWVLKPQNSLQWHHEVDAWLKQWTRGTE